MNMLDKAEALKERTKQFAIRIITVVRSRPWQPTIEQFCRARSKAEFISKMSIVVEEADETLFWLDLLTDTGVVSKEKLSLVVVEANELLAICAASLRTAKYNKQ